MRFKFPLITLVLSFGLFLGLKTFAIEENVAPTTPPAVESTSIIINSIPENPEPNQDVTVTLSSFAENLDNLSIVWTVNDKNFSTGIGKKSISLKAPSAGIETKIKAKISLPEGDVEVNTIIRPSVMVLLWQAEDSYVPPFYKGKAMPTSDTFIKVVAIPEIKSGNSMVSSGNLVYNWQKDYSGLPSSSGFGRNYLIFKNDYLENSSNISVTASTTDQKYSSGGSLKIEPVSPEIVFYAKNNDTGIAWEKSLKDSHEITGNETIVGAPYFISPKDIRRPDLSFSWFINDIPVSVENFMKNSISIKSEEDASGTSEIRLEVENKYQILQRISKVIKINF